MECNIPKSKRTGSTTKNQLSSETDYIFLQGKVWSFNKIEDLQEFLKKKTDFNREFATQIQNSRESP